MLKRRHIPEPHNEHPNVVPLIDVMLCIIVFYMLAAKIGVASGADESIRIPVTTLGSELNKVGGGTNTLILNVRERVGEPAVTAMVDGGSGQLVELPLTDTTSGRRTLRDTLRAFIVGKDGVQGTADDNPQLKVVIRADGEMTYKSFMPVMLNITDAGVTNILHNTAKPGSAAAGGTP